MMAKRKFSVYMKTEILNKWDSESAQVKYDFLGDTYAASPQQACNNIAYRLKIKKHDEKMLPYGNVETTSMEAIEK